MKGLFEIGISFILLHITTKVVSSAASLGTFSDEDSNEGGVSRQRRQWNMMRLGRGLQMLRLGKRDIDFTRDFPSLRLGTAPSSSSAGDDKLSLSHDQFLNILNAILEQNQARDETRRQPPLPRYGRRSVALGRRTLTSGPKEDRANRIFPLDFSPMDDPVFRQPPRGGRYKRSASLASPVEVAQLTSDPRRLANSPDSEIYRNFIRQNGINNAELGQRAVTLPRIGRYLNQAQYGVYRDMRPKAVPHPRIGRGSDNISQVDTISESKTSSQAEQRQA